MGWWEDMLERDRKTREQNTERWNKIFGNTPFAAPPVPKRQQPQAQPPAPAAVAQYHSPAGSNSPPPPHYPPPHFDPRVYGARLNTGEESSDYYIKKGRADGRAQEYKPPHTAQGFVGHWVAGTYFGPRPPFDMFGKPRPGKDIHLSSNPVYQANIEAYNEGFKQGRLELSMTERMMKWWL